MGFHRLAAVRVLMAAALAVPLIVCGCGGQGESGALVEKAPGQESGEKASQDFMKAHMKEMNKK
jgi:hypothetical protein